jgi:hypothetical protein
MMNEAADGFVRDAIREIVELQLREDAPAEVGESLARLMAQGYLREEAATLIACALSQAMSRALTGDQAFDAAAYLEALAALPAMEWD